MSADRPRAEPHVALTRSQVDVWLGDRSSSWPTAQIAPGYWVPAAVDPELLSRALADVVAHHIPLRTRITPGPAVPHASLRDVPARFPLAHVDLRGTPPAERTSAAERIWAEQAVQPFDLSQDWPLRATLVTLDDDAHLLVLLLSHVIADGWSCGVLVDELRDRYRSLLKDPDTAREGPAEAWSRYVREYEADSASGRLTRDLPWWRDQLADAPWDALPSVGADADDDADLTSASLFFELSPEIGTGLHEVASSLRSSVYCVTLAVLAVTLADWTAREEVLTTVPYARREESDYEPLVGLFAHRLALRLPVDRDTPFPAVVHGVQEVLLDALDHADVTFPRIQQSLRAAGTPVSARISAQVYPRSMCEATPTESGGLPFRLLGFQTPVSRLSLALYLVEPDDGPLTGWLTHRTTVLPAEQAEQFLALLLAVLRTAIATPEETVCDLLEAARVRPPVAVPRSGFLDPLIQPCASSATDCHFSHPARRCS